MVFRDMDLVAAGSFVFLEHTFCCDISVSQGFVSFICTYNCIYRAFGAHHEINAPFEPERRWIIFRITHWSPMLNHCLPKSTYTVQICRPSDKGPVEVQGGTLKEEKFREGHWRKKSSGRDIEWRKVQGGTLNEEKSREGHWMKKSSGRDIEWRKCQGGTLKEENVREGLWRKIMSGEGHWMKRSPGRDIEGRKGQGGTLNEEKSREGHWRKKMSGRDIEWREVQGGTLNEEKSREGHWMKRSPGRDIEWRKVLGGTLNEDIAVSYSFAMTQYTTSLSIYRYVARFMAFKATSEYLKGKCGYQSVLLQLFIHFKKYAIMTNRVPIDVNPEFRLFVCFDVF